MFKRKKQMYMVCNHSNIAYLRHEIIAEGIPCYSRKISLQQITARAIKADFLKDLKDQTNKIQLVLNMLAEALIVNSSKSRNTWFTTYDFLHLLAQNWLLRLSIFQESCWILDENSKPSQTLHYQNPNCTGPNTVIGVSELLYIYRLKKVLFNV